MKRLTMLVMVLCIAMAAVGCGGGTAKYEFKPSDANLEYANNVIVENSPENLGGWTDDQIVSFPLSIKKDAEYEVSLTYSRPGPVGINLSISNDSSSEEFTTWLEHTSDSDADWSKYTESVVGTIKLTKDDKALDLMARSDNGSYVINLQKLVLTEVAAGQQGAKPIAADDGQGGGEPAVTDDEPQGGDGQDRYFMEDRTYIGNVDDVDYELNFYDDGLFSASAEDESLNGGYYIVDGIITLLWEDEELEWSVLDDESIMDDNGNIFYLDNGDDPSGDAFDGVISGLYAPVDETPYDCEGYYFGADGYAAMTYPGEMHMGASFTIDGNKLTIDGPDMEFYINDEDTLVYEESGIMYTRVYEDAQPSGEYIEAFEGSGASLYFYSDGTVDFDLDGETQEGTYTCNGPDISITINDETIVFTMLDDYVLTVDEGDGNRLTFADESLL